MKSHAEYGKKCKLEKYKESCIGKEHKLEENMLILGMQRSAAYYSDCKLQLKLLRETLFHGLCNLLRETLFHGAMQSAS